MVACKLSFLLVCQICFALFVICPNVLDFSKYINVGWDLLGFKYWSSFAGVCFTGAVFSGFFVSGSGMGAVFSGAGFLGAAAYNRRNSMVLCGADCILEKQQTFIDSKKHLRPRPRCRAAWLPRLPPLPVWVAWRWARRRRALRPTLRRRQNPTIAPSPCTWFQFPQSSS